MVGQQHNLDGGNSYTFILSATYSDDPSNMDKYEEIVIVMNERPYGGAIMSTPTSGTALNTSFLLETFDWIDDPGDRRVRQLAPPDRLRRLLSDAGGDRHEPGSHGICAGVSREHGGGARRVAWRHRAQWHLD